MWNSYFRYPTCLRASPSTKTLTARHTVGVCLSSAMAPHGEQRRKSMFTGSVTINGVSDKDLVKILEVTIKHEKVVQFNPNQLQVLNTNQPSQQLYDNVVLIWQNEDGMFAVHKIISILLEKEERSEAKAAG